MKLFSLGLLLLSFLWLGACTRVPDGVEPVQNFQLQRYLGHWYEIARLDHSFERGLTLVTADYSLNPDGSVAVVNTGYSKGRDAWQLAEGRAEFVGPENVGHLKVSFLGPFYSAYIVIALADDYQYAMVSGYDKSYLWILSRTPTMPQAALEQFLQKAKAMDYPVDQLIFPKQEAQPVIKNSVQPSAPGSVQ
ncbi:lipocalin family protein [Microbulbifer sp. OS29]|uniref:Outer membrane lipoprotein Blc n=1 Tax=Microbulbifer okhotskensis TaxID=2926617 RepID=A0A9X2EIS1_9GAMM|nr:lipocalin family protein [Microbulbifer okhotskensis]MCO1333019.1 lipocalin family protein [Microbulbifer okhotskensis]